MGHPDAEPLSSPRGCPGRLGETVSSQENWRSRVAFSPLPVTGGLIPSPATQPLPLPASAGTPLGACRLETMSTHRLPSSGSARLAQPHPALWVLPREEACGLCRRTRAPPFPPAFLSLSFLPGRMKGRANECSPSDGKAHSGAVMS